MATATRTTTTRLTIPTLKRGERYAGLILNNGKLKGGHHLILLPGEGQNLTHAAALDWAKKKKAHLPERTEARLLWANQPKEFKPEAYWLATPCGGLDAYAWVQRFYGGGQLYNHKNNEFRARAVRRVPHSVIPPFTHFLCGASTQKWQPPNCR
jgi:hypothetical protein